MAQEAEGRCYRRLIQKHVIGFRKDRREILTVFTSDRSAEAMQIFLISITPYKSG